MFGVRTNHVKYLLPDFLNSQLDDEQRVAVQIHLQECAACRSEKDGMQASFEIVRSEREHRSPNNYFNNVLPRVRVRLEQKHPDSWLQHPLWTRLGMPFVAAAVAIALLVHVPASFQGRSGDILGGLSSSLEIDDMADIMAQQHELLPLSTVVTQEVAASVLSERIVNRQIAARLMAAQYEKEYDYLSGIPTDQLVNNLSDREVEALLQKLAEKVIE